MLAYYSSEFGGGVLGPRGWHCSERYGSSGWTLLIVPPAIGPEPRLARGAGSAIVLDEQVGDTSGRIFVAKVIARMFPVYDWFIARVRNLEEYPPENLPSGPYPKDRLTNRTDSSVEFETPPGNEGLGTLGGNAKSDYTTRGIVMVRGRNDTPNVIQLSVRLPATLSGLTPEIISQLKREHPASTR